MNLSGTTIFLLSPASVTGVRAKQLRSPSATFPAARAYQSAEGVPITEGFSFMSALYFRGKIAYARRFGRVEGGTTGSVFVIAPGFGLVGPDWSLTAERIETMASTPVALDDDRYCEPLRRDAVRLFSTLESSARVVLLGSVATGKYVDVLRPIFGDQLVFPRVFAGLGDMSRGALMLRAAESGEELEYVTLDAARHRKTQTF